MTPARSKSLPVVLIAATAAILIIVLAVPGGTFRLMAVMAYLLICPGIAFTGLLALRDPLAALILGIGLSISLDILISEALVLAHLWSPVAALLILGLLCLVGAMLQLKQPRRLQRVRETGSDRDSH